MRHTQSCFFGWLLRGESFKFPVGTLSARLYCIVRTVTFNWQRFGEEEASAPEVDDAMTAALGSHGWCSFYAKNCLNWLNFISSAWIVLTTVRGMIRNWCHWTHSPPRTAIRVLVNIPGRKGLWNIPQRKMLNDRNFNVGCDPKISDPDHCHFFRSVSFCCLLFSRNFANLLSLI